MIFRLFDQAVLVVGQVFNFIRYLKRLNILPALIDNNTKIIEILKEESLKLDNVGNKCLLRDHFEENLSKVNCAKQKLKSLFTRLQKKRTFANSKKNGATNHHQLPFRQGPLPQDNQGGKGRGMFFASGKERGTNFFSSVASTGS